MCLILAIVSLATFASPDRPAALNLRSPDRHPAIPRPLKQVYARAVTLCIALKATDWSFEPQTWPLSSAIALCSDSLASNDYTSTEHVPKWELLPSHFVVMFAGPLSAAKELLEVVRTQLCTIPADTTTLVEALRQSVQIQKARLANAHVGATLGISYQDFRKHGKAWFLEDVCRQVTSEIEAIRLEVELIVAGFINREATIVKVQYDRVSISDNFATIGAGSFLAEASLMQRDYVAIGDVNHAAYLAYEAKRLGERAPGVGRQTSVMSMTLDREAGPVLNVLKLEHLAVLDEQFKRFGPQDVTWGGVRQLPQDAWLRAMQSGPERTTNGPSTPPPLPG
jgi:hypothetical protein